mmetsp:Transcript_7095/g.21694  ORF Transcript_7095/g.21694 Transcript_7095/m.21694 type:complete len:372 (-) Transcript_7095:1818-2933(-)
MPLPGVGTLPPPRCRVDLVPVLLPPDAKPYQCGSVPLPVLLRVDSPRVAPRDPPAPLVPLPERRLLVAHSRLCDLLLSLADFPSRGRKQQPPARAAQVPLQRQRAVLLRSSAGPSPDSPTLGLHLLSEHLQQLHTRLAAVRLPATVLSPSSRRHRQRRRKPHRESPSLWCLPLLLSLRPGHTPAAGRGAGSRRGGAGGAANLALDAGLYGAAAALRAAHRGREQPPAARLPGLRTHGERRTRAHLLRLPAGVAPSECRRRELVRSQLLPLAHGHGVHARSLARLPPPGEQRTGLSHRLSLPPVALPRATASAYRPCAGAALPPACGANRGPSAARAQRPSAGQFTVSVHSVRTHSHHQVPAVESLGYSLDR